MGRTSRGLATVAVAALLGLWGSSVSAQQTTTTTETKKFQVIDVDGNKLVVRLPEGTKEITVPEDFRFTVNGQQLSVHELKPGMSGTAEVKTITTTKPVTVTEVRNGTVTQVSGSTIIVSTPNGYRMFTPGDVEKRNVKIIKDGKPVELSELRAGDRLSATIVTEKPPQVMTEKQVRATVNPERAAAQAPATAAPAAPTPTPAATTGTPAASAPAAKKLPKTASQAPLLGLIGLVSMGLGVALAMFRTRAKE